MLERIQKIISAAGVTSRRAAEDLITEGRVRVNGVVVTELGTRADASKDHIKVDGKLINPHQPLTYIMLNKPAGFVTTMNDPEKRPTVDQLLKGVKVRVYPVGRLDYNTEGLLLMTNDGDFAHLITHPKHEFPKTYRAKVKGVLEDRQIEELEQGIYLDDGKTAPAKVKKISKEEANSWLEITIHEGRKRQVRRMFDRVGHSVIKLKRVRTGNLLLGDLPEGAFRYLLPEEVAALKDLAVKEDKPEIRVKKPMMKSKESEVRRPAAGARGHSTGGRGQESGDRKPAFRSERPEGGSRPGFSRPRPEVSSSRPAYDRPAAGVRSQESGDRRPDYRSPRPEGGSRPAFNRSRPEGGSRQGFGRSRPEGIIGRPEFNRPRPENNSSRPTYSKPISEVRSQESGDRRPGFSRPRPESSGGRPEYRSQRPEGGSRPGFSRPRPESSGGRPEYRSQRPEGGSRPGFGRPRPESSGGRPEYRSQRPEGGSRPGFSRPRPEGGGSRPEYRGQRTESRGSYAASRSRKPEPAKSRIGARDWHTQDNTERLERQKSRPAFVRSSSGPAGQDVRKPSASVERRPFADRGAHVSADRRPGMRSEGQGAREGRPGPGRTRPDTGARGTFRKGPAGAGTSRSAMGARGSKPSRGPRRER